jgi:predicted aldo/keto reductase-like oxidoreductase
MGANLELFLRDLQSRSSGSAPLPKRNYREGVSLSCVGFGGLMLVGMLPERANRLVADSVERGVNFFDVAPSYGDGEAEDKLGVALEPYRKSVFLAGKTKERSGAGLRLELERSLRRLRADFFDLYQLHAVNRTSDMEGILAPCGAADALLRARERGLVRFIGFSAHSVPVALALLDRFDFDSISFPVNFVCYARGNFGPQVLAKARAQGLARVALKSLAYSPWQHLQARVYPNCWYRPIDEPALARDALRFAFSEDVTSVLPPADERLYLMAVALACGATPLTEEERQALFEQARGVKPILRAKRTHSMSDE